MELARPTVAELRCAMCDVVITEGVACKDCTDFALESVGVPRSPISIKSDYPSNSVDCVTCNHLWMREEWFVVYGTVLTGAEATELPWRRRKDHELATPNEIRRDLELVQALYVRGTNQGPSAFDSVALYLREDIG